MEETKKKLSIYYNKFSEDKRLSRRHGQVEFITTMKYIHDYLKSGDRILDVGAGTGAYAIPLFKEGYDVTALELTRPNVMCMKKNCPELSCFEGDGRDLSRFESDSFDVVLLLGPLYHLHEEADKLLALSEAKRVLKKNGVVLVAYLMNEYALIKHAFIDGHYDSVKDFLDKDFRILEGGNELYSYARLEDLECLAFKSGLERVITFAPDGAADYIRSSLNSLSEEAFEAFVRFQLSICERKELLGASSHLVDVLRKV